MNHWDFRFLDLAKLVSSWSKDPSTKVGAVIADGKLVRSLGFNGFPPTCEDKPEWYNDRETKYKLVIHAESNALVHSGHSVVGCTVYTYPLAPCPECAKLLVASGIKRVVAGIDLDATSTRRFISTEETEFILKANNIEFEKYIYTSGGHTEPVSPATYLQPGERPSVWPTISADTYGTTGTARAETNLTNVQSWNQVPKAIVVPDKQTGTG